MFFCPSKSQMLQYACASFKVEVKSQNQKISGCIKPYHILQREIEKSNIVSQIKPEFTKKDQFNSQDKTLPKKLLSCEIAKDNKVSQRRLIDAENKEQGKSIFKKFSLLQLQIVKDNAISQIGPRNTEAFQNEQQFKLPLSSQAEMGSLKDKKSGIVGFVKTDKQSQKNEERDIIKSNKNSNDLQTGLKAFSISQQTNQRARFDKGCEILNEGRIVLIKKSYERGGEKKSRVRQQPARSSSVFTAVTKNQHRIK